MSLTFDALRNANVTRCEASFHPLMAWSPMDWGCALAGETGEACNLVKKLHRGEPGDHVNVDDIGRELADVICYADMLAARLGLNLGEFVRRKFNEVSVKRGSPVRL